MARRKPSDASGAPDVSVVKGSITQTILPNKPYSFDEFGYYRKSGEKKPCSWVVNKKNPKPFPVGRVELEMVTNEKAAKLGIPNGPALRLCYGKDEASPVVSVKTPDEALKIAKQFRDCAVKGDDKRTCAVKALGTENLTIAGLRRKRRSRR